MVPRYCPCVGEVNASLRSTAAGASWDGGAESCRLRPGTNACRIVGLDIPGVGSAAESGACHGAGGVTTNGGSLIPLVEDFSRRAADIQVIIGGGIHLLPGEGGGVIGTQSRFVRWDSQGVTKINSRWDGGYGGTKIRRLRPGTVAGGVVGLDIPGMIPTAEGDT